MPINLQNQDLVEFVYQTPNSTSSSNYSDGSIVFHTDGNYTKIKLPGSVQTSDNFSIGDSENKEIAILVAVNFVDASEAYYTQGSTDITYTLADYISDCSSYTHLGPLVYISDHFGNFITRYHSGSSADPYFDVQYHRYTVTEDSNVVNSHVFYSKLSDVNQEYIYIEDINGFTKKIERKNPDNLNCDVYYEVTYTFTGDLKYKIHSNCKNLEYEGVKFCAGQSVMNSEIAQSAINALSPVVAIPDRQYSDLNYIDDFWLVQLEISDALSTKVTARTPLASNQFYYQSTEFKNTRTNISWIVEDSTLIYDLQQDVTDVHMFNYALDTSDTVSNISVGTAIFEDDQVVEINAVTNDSSYGITPYTLRHLERSPFELYIVVDPTRISVVVPDSYLPDGSVNPNPDGKYIHCVNCSLINLIQCKRGYIPGFVVGAIDSLISPDSYQYISQNMLHNSYIPQYYGSEMYYNTKTNTLSGTCYKFADGSTNPESIYTTNNTITVLAANPTIVGNSKVNSAQYYLDNCVRNCSMFNNFTSLKLVVFDGFDFSFVTSLNQMFYSCYALELLWLCYTSPRFISENEQLIARSCDDANYINLNKITELKHMFYHDDALVELNFGTSINWFNIYKNCYLANDRYYDAMSYCFDKCDALTTIYTDESAIGFEGRYTPEFISNFYMGAIPSIVGGNGTTFDGGSLIYARIDGSQPGYFTWYMQAV